MNNTVPINKIMNGSALQHLKELPNESIDCVITSPPYWALRDYNIEEQLGLEPTFEEYISKLCDIFDEVKRVLKKEGTVWVNIGDTYSSNSSYSSKGRAGYEKKESMINHNTLIEKSLCMIPFRFAIEMVNRKWILRNTIIWHKPNAMPSSVKDRFTVDYEYVFLLVKNKKYYFETQYEPHTSQDPRDGERIIKEKSRGLVKGNPNLNNQQLHSHFVAYGKEGRNKRTVWKIPTSSFPEAHFATFPEELCETPIKAGCPKGGIVLDCFFGAGTTGLVALKLNRNFIGIEINPDYIKIAKDRLKPYLEQKKLT